MSEPDNIPSEIAIYEDSSSPSANQNETLNDAKTPYRHPGRSRGTATKREATYYEEPKPVEYNYSGYGDTSPFDESTDQTAENSRVLELPSNHNKRFLDTTYFAHSPLKPDIPITEYIYHTEKFKTGVHRYNQVFIWCVQHRKNLLSRAHDRICMTALQNMQNMLSKTESVAYYLKPIAHLKPAVPNPENTIYRQNIENMKDFLDYTKDEMREASDELLKTERHLDLLRRSDMYQPAPSNAYTSETQDLTHQFKNILENIFNEVLIASNNQEKIIETL